MNIVHTISQILDRAHVHKCTDEIQWENIEKRTVDKDTANGQKEAKRDGMRRGE